MLMLSLSERRAIAATAIRANPARSDRSIAKLTGICRETVARVRSELLRDGAVEPRERVIGGDGRNYPASPRGVRPAPPELARQTAKILALIPAIDVEAWRVADVTTKQSFRLACERLATAARRLDEGRERGAG